MTMTADTPGPAPTSRTGASSRSPDRWSTSSSRRTRCPRSTTALELDIELDGETITVTAEVAQQIGEGRVPRHLHEARPTA